MATSSQPVLLPSLATLVAPRREHINSVSLEVLEMVKGTLAYGQHIGTTGSTRAALAPLAVLTCLEQRINVALRHTMAVAGDAKPPMEAINSAFAVFCVIDRFLNPAGLQKELLEKSNINNNDHSSSASIEDDVAAVEIAGAVLREALVGALAESLWGQGACVTVEVEDPGQLLTSSQNVEAIVAERSKASAEHQVRSVDPFVKEFVKRSEGLAKRWDNSFALVCGLRGVKLVLSANAIESVRRLKAEQLLAVEDARMEEARRKEKKAAEEAARLAAKAAPTVTKAEVKEQLVLIRTIKRLLTSGISNYDRASVHLPKHRVSHYLSRLQRALESHDQQQRVKIADAEDAEDDESDDDEYEVGGGGDQQTAAEEDGKNKKGKSKKSKNNEPFEVRLQNLQGDLVREMSELAAKQELAALVSSKGATSTAEGGDADDLADGADDSTITPAGREEEVLDETALLNIAGGRTASSAKLPIYYSPFNLITDVQQHTTLARRLPGGANPSRSGYPIFACPSIVGSFVTFPRGHAGKMAVDAGYITTPQGAKIPSGCGRMKVLINELEDNRKYIANNNGLTKALSYEDRSYDAVAENLFGLLWRTTGLVMRPPGASHPGAFKVPKNKGMRFLQYQREMGLDPDHPSSEAFSPIDGAYLRSDPRIDRRTHPFSWREILIYPPTHSEEDETAILASTNQSPTPHAEWLALQKINADMNLGVGGVLSGSIFDRGTTVASAAVESVTVAQRCWFQTFDQWEASVDEGRIPTLREKVLAKTNNRCVVGGRATMLSDYARMCSPAPSNQQVPANGPNAVSNNTSSPSGGGGGPSSSSVAQAVNMGPIASASATASGVGGGVTAIGGSMMVGSKRQRD